MWAELLSGLGNVGNKAMQVGSDMITKAPGTGQAQDKWNRIGSVLGQFGSSIAPEGTWQHGLGKKASELSVQDLYGKRMGKVDAGRTKRRSGIDEAIAGLGGVTPKGMPGVTGYEMGKDGDYTLKGDLGIPELKMDPTLNKTINYGNDFTTGLQDQSNFL